MTSAAAPPLHAPSEHRTRQAVFLGLSFLATVPGLYVRLVGTRPGGLAGPGIFGLAVLGAAFVLAAAAEVLQLDVSQGLALALLALIAVLPEYAVDFAFTWKAGTDPDQYAPLALANMTGGNRLLIGVGWPLVVLLAASRIRHLARRNDYRGELETDVVLDRPHSIELAFLALATLYSLTLPLKHDLVLVDSAVLVGLFVLFLIRVGHSPAEEPHLVGPAQLVGSLPKHRRRLAVGAMFVWAAAAIFLCAEPFAESLVHLGEEHGISTFLLVQWVAPLASEAPEIVVAALFAWRLNTSAGFATLLSSKVNQWTLLVGTLPIVFSISAGRVAGLPLDSLQREELFLTAAQSAFAVAVLANRRIGVREAWALFGLFASQFVLGALLPESARVVERVGVGILYLVLAAGLLFRQRHAALEVARDGLRTPVGELVHDPHDPGPTD